MSTDFNAQSANQALNSASAANPALSARNSRAQKAAKDFEGAFLSQMLSQMFSGLSTDEEFGGGAGEDMFRSLMIDEYGKKLEAHGGIGLADSVLKELVKTQERAS